MKSQRTSRNVFRNTTKKNKTDPTRQITEALLMLSTGFVLLLLINKIPQNINWIETTKDNWIDLILGLEKIFGALFYFVMLGLVILGIFSGLILILGGSWRVIKLYANKKNKIKRTQSSPYLKKDR